MSTLEDVKADEPVAKLAKAKVAPVAVPYQGMEALDFSEFMSDDTPEMAEFKRQVVRVAKKYATNHGWCSVVDRALEEMGAVPSVSTVDVKVSTDFMEIVVKVKPEDLAGLTVKRQVAKIATLIGPIAMMGSANVRGSMTIKPEAITAMKIVTKPKQMTVPQGVPADDEAYRFRYLSDTSRVAHALRRSEVDDTAGSLRHMGQYATVCNTAANLRSVTAHSSRGEDRLCDRCAAAVRRERP